MGRLPKASEMPAARRRVIARNLPRSTRHARRFQAFGEAVRFAWEGFPSCSIFAAHRRTLVERRHQIAPLDAGDRGGCGSGPGYRIRGFGAITAPTIDAPSRPRNEGP